MMRLTSWLAWCWCAASAAALELNFDFSKWAVNEAPPEFRSAVAGAGPSGSWKIIWDDVPPTIPRLSAQAPAVSKRPVLAQLSTDSTDEHFPLLIYDAQVFGDFTLSTRFKTVSGLREQMAGLAFRIQDAKNFYVLRASSLGNNVRFYPVINGERGKLVGADLPVPKGVWHELAVECKGNHLRCLLDGKEVMPPLTDYAFTKGKIGFWTKSDSVSYFADTKIQYVPQEPVAQALLRDQLRVYPRLLGLRIYASTTAKTKPHIIASMHQNEVGQPAGSAEEDAIARDLIYCSNPKGTVTVTLPLHDRNGEVMAAAQLKLKSFPGQTEQNAIARAMPVVRAIEARVRTKADLIQ